MGRIWALESDYFIGKKDGKMAIYKIKDSQINKITDDFNYINETGLVEGKSDYFLARKDNKEFLCQYKDDKIERINDGFYKIKLFGLVDGKSNYFSAKKGKSYYVYHKSLDKKLLLDRFEKNDSDIMGYKQNKTLTKLPQLFGKC